MSLSSEEIRQRFLDYFAEREHAIIPSASLVPENDPTTLFTSSGMQPMVPYLLGQTHPLGKRIADSQKCFRADDIDEVGDNRHTTFFEMLGNWSLGDYFKEEQLEWFFTFMTEELKLPPERLYVTVFAGDSNLDLPRDDESVAIWQKLFKGVGIDATTSAPVTEDKAAEIGMEGARIFYYGSKNWWSRWGPPEKMPTGEPGGPDSEVFFEFVDVEHDPKYGEHCHPNCDCGRFLEVGNSVFMEYLKTQDGRFEPLPQKNVDFGGGLERLAAAAINNSDVFSIDSFKPMIEKLEELSGRSYSDEQHQGNFRVIADHIRGAVFMIADGITPSNTETGYFVRRLIRRSVRRMDLLGIEPGKMPEFVYPLAKNYRESYPELEAAQDSIAREVKQEETKFRKTLESGLKEFHKVAENTERIDGETAFTLFSTYGLPIDVTVELAAEDGKHVDIEGFEAALEKHRELSRAGADKKFKGGLASTGEMEVKYHTATHLLNAALREVLGEHVGQKGSNITSERLRFDFNHPEKLTDEQKQRVEAFVNKAIQDDLPVSQEEVPLQDAYDSGAIGVFGETYPDTVKVYTVGNEETGVVSKEICGGPHVEHTGELNGTFRIKKEESVSAGVRRIKAVLE